MVRKLIKYFVKKGTKKGLERDSVRDIIMTHFDILDDFLLDRS